MDLKKNRKTAHFWSAEWCSYSIYYTVKKNFKVVNKTNITRVAFT